MTMLRGGASSRIEATRSAGAIMRSSWGCTSTNLTRFADTFAEYEGKYEIVTGPLRHLEEMRIWLTTAYKKRELGLRDGKVDRLAFQERFELRGGTSLLAIRKFVIYLMNLMNAQNRKITCRLNENKISIALKRLWLEILH